MTKKGKYNDTQNNLTELERIWPVFPFYINCGFHLVDLLHRSDGWTESCLTDCFFHHWSPYRPVEWISARLLDHQSFMLQHSKLFSILNIVCVKSVPQHTNKTQRKKDYTYSTWGPWTLVIYYGVFVHTTSWKHIYKISEEWLSSSKLRKSFYRTQNVDDISPHCFQYIINAVVATQRKQCYDLSEI